MDLDVKKLPSRGVARCSSGRMLLDVPVINLKAKIDHCSNTLKYVPKNEVD